MSGVYGAINSRDDFFATLDRTLHEAQKYYVAQPGDTAQVKILAQLKAMKQMTAGGRTPTETERASIDIGLIAVREFEETNDPDLAQFAQDLGILNNYFEDWPTDEQAANATDDDFWDE